MPGTDQTFACPQCGQQFPWKPEFAGRKLACACGHQIDVQAPPDPDTYDLRDDEPPIAARVVPLDEPPPGQLALDSTGQEIPPAKPVKPAKVLSYRRLGAVEQSGVSDDVRSRRRDFWVPLAMIAASLPLLALLALIMSHDPSYTWVSIPWVLGLRIVWDIAMMFITAMAIYSFIDTGFGEFNTAILKLVALALFRFSLSAIIGADESIGMAFVGLVFTFPILAFLFGYLFEFDFTESMFCAVLATLMRLISYFGLWRILELL